MDPLVFYLISVVVGMAIVLGTVLIAERLALKKAERLSGSTERPDGPPSSGR
ncbi:MAG: hypothetical protein HY720_07055 [Planctomycetes bacterium]|nr:hypothetical protein [Planctomycetota bacterium]